MAARFTHPLEPSIQYSNPDRRDVLLVKRGLSTWEASLILIQCSLERLHRFILVASNDVSHGSHLSIRPSENGLSSSQERFGIFDVAWTRLVTKVGRPTAQIRQVPRFRDWRPHASLRQLLSEPSNIMRDC